MVALVAIAVLTLAGCGGTATHRAAVTRVATPTSRATPTEPAALGTAARHGVGVIKLAFDRLIDDHVTAADEAALLNAGWDGIRKAAEREQVEPGRGPVFNGDRAADFAAFRGAYLALPRGLRESGAGRYAAIDAMAQSLDDCHTYYLGPSLDDPDVAPDKTLSDFGMTLAGKPAVVANTDSFSPASTAGIERRDTIVGVGTEDTSDKNALDVLILLAGHERGGVVRDFPASGFALDNVRPTVVLVDDGSASMSEIFALGLKEHGVARIAGQKSAGCIGETRVTGLGDGSGLAVSFGVMLGPVTGAELNGAGIAPDDASVRTVDDVVGGVIRSLMPPLHR